MKKSTIQLSKFFITNLNIKWVKGKASGNAIKLGFDFNLAFHEEHKNHFKLEFSVLAIPEDGFSGIRLETQIDGYFHFPEGIDFKEMHYLAILNGSSILYGILRGQLALITGSFPGGKFMLPAVVMEDVIPEVIKMKQQEVEKQEKKQKKISAKPNKNKSKKKTPSQ